MRKLIKRVNKKKESIMLTIFFELKQIIVSKRFVLLTNSTKSFIVEISNDDERFSKKFRIEINFELFDELIYYIKNETCRLYFFFNFEEKIFRLIYDENLHVEIHRYFKQNNLSKVKK